MRCYRQQIGQDAERTTMGAPDYGSGLVRRQAVFRKGRPRFLDEGVRSKLDRASFGAAGAVMAMVG